VTLAYNVTSTSLNPEVKIIFTTRPTALQASLSKFSDLTPLVSSSSLVQRGMSLEPGARFQ